MAWQAEVGSGSNRATTYHDLLNKMVLFMCSQHVATVAPNAAGTGYVVGDVLTLTHASAHLNARFEVTSVGGSGEVTGLRIVSSGAFAQRATSATVSAGGSGYAVGNILQVQGGSSRCPAKFVVDTVSSGAVTAVSVFEGGGVYATTPSNPAATLGVGPSTFAGNNACTLSVTYQSIIGTTGLSVTGGSGSGATVDITLAETGWAVDERNTNNRSHNGVLNEKEVALVGDATGRTNKPYIGFGTFTATSGVDTRYIITLYAMVSHNPALAFSSSPGFVGEPGTWNAGRPYLLCDENQLQQMDFWFSADDLRVCGVVNINPGAANTDDGQYMHFYHGFLDTFATEAEDPYPAYVMASSRTPNIDPSASSTNITGMAELLAPGGSSVGAFFYQSEAGAWRGVTNSQGTANQQFTSVCWPVSRLTTINGSVDQDSVVTEGQMRWDTAFGSIVRASPTVRLFPVPGTTPHFFPYPLTILYRPGSASLDPTNDTIRGQLRGCFLLYNTTGAGATVANFSEDYITIGSDRYRIFQSHVQRQLYNYICIKEDV